MPEGLEVVSKVSVHVMTAEVLLAGKACELPKVVSRPGEGLHERGN